MKNICARVARKRGFIMRAYERFLKYAAYPTMSDENSGTHPSSAKQLVLGRELARELSELGLTNVELDSFGYVYGTLPRNTTVRCNTVALIAHMDTSPDASDENIKCQLMTYEGRDLLLNPELGIYLKREDYPCLDGYVGQTLIVSDGTTLIGADDKAGIAEIMTALERLIAENIPHGDIRVCFTPDEEIGEGADNIDMSRLSADYGYTVDGGALGELEYENFNAASAKVTVHGRSIHPGSAKDRMINAARIVAELNSYLPERETPEHTSEYQGFYHMTGISGECETASVSYIIRDHDRTRFEARKSFFREVVEKLNRKYGEGVVELNLTDSYFNMREIVEGNMFVVERARNAMRAVGVSPITTPIRGGTDGARLSFMGLPCPNLSTGGENFHSRFEFVSVESMDKMVDVIVRIATDVVGELCEEINL